jgi:general L-amino acid transport system permease protein
MRTKGLLERLRRELFGSPLNAALTVIMTVALVLVLVPIWRWAVSQATFWGDSRAACDGVGACWAIVTARLPSYFFGAYPADQRWRPILVVLLLIAAATPVLRQRTMHRGWWLGALLVPFPIIAGCLLWGGILGLPYVDTTAWGGLLVNIVLAFTGLAGALPLGILLALGRRSELPLVRGVCIAFIELWRGVPLLTVLFMAAVMLPLFLPEGATLDRLLRAMLALALFTAAYMAEAVRGGLQGVPRGQAEAATSLGLGWWKVQALVVLPQALRIALPSIVNIVVDLFKDTTLVTIVGIADLLGIVNLALRDQAWLGLAREGYLFSAMVFCLCCLVLTQVGAGLERRSRRDRL